MKDKTLAESVADIGGAIVTFIFFTGLIILMATIAVGIFTAFLHFLSYVPEAWLEVVQSFGG